MFAIDDFLLGAASSATDSVLGLGTSLITGAINNGYAAEAAEQQFKYNKELMALQNEYNTKSAAKQYEYNLGLMSAQSGYNSSALAQQQSYNASNAESQYNYNLGLMGQQSAYNKEATQQQYRNSIDYLQNYYGNMRTSLESAGYNPLLAVGQTAPTYTGSALGVSGGSSGLPSSSALGVSGGSSSALGVSALAVQRAAARLSLANSAVAAATVPSQIRANSARANQLDADSTLTHSQARLTDAQALEARARAAVMAKKYQLEKEAIQGFPDISIGDGKYDYSDTEKDYIQMIKNDIQQQRYNSSREHQIYRDVLDGLETGSKFIPKAKSGGIHIHR